MSQSIEFRKAEEKNHKILLVDDNSCLLEVTCQILTEEDYQITKAESGEEAIETLHKQDFDLVITDLNMGEVNGIEVLKKTKELNPKTMVIIMTANPYVPFYLDALRDKFCDYVLKPFDADDLLERVSHCISKLKSRRANKRKQIHKALSNDHNVSV